MRVWVVRYALTKGIFEIDGHVDLRNIDCVQDKNRKPATGPGFYCGDDWIDCEKTAKVMADTMRIKKIMSLEKQIIKLRKMKF